MGADVPHKDKQGRYELQPGRINGRVYYQQITRESLRNCTSGLIDYMYFRFSRKGKKRTNFGRSFDYKNKRRRSTQFQG